MAGYKLICLGTPLLSFGDHPVKLEMRKAMALLVYLRMAEHDISRESLATLFWPEFDQKHAQANLRRVLSSLNKSLEINLIEADREKVCLRDRSLLWLDVDALKQCLAFVANHSHLDLGACIECNATLEEAIRLYRGDFLEGFNLGDCPEFDEWQFLQSENLRLEFSRILSKATDGYAAGLKWDSAISYARHWIALDKLNEQAQRCLISLYIQAGLRSAALKQCDEFERLIKVELNQEPEKESIELLRIIRQGQPEPPVLPVPPPARIAGAVTPEPLLKSKLYIPLTRSKRVQRERLSDLLNRIEQHPVVILSAPAGFGKTTALTQWLLQSQLSAGWVSLDSTDNDPHRFLSYLVGALESIQSLSEIDFSGAVLFRQAISMHPVLVSLLHALEQSNASYVLVLDDYQYIESPQVHELVGFMLDHLPSGMHLVISSRADPPFPLARLRAGDRLLEIRTNDLRFTREEAVAYLNQVMGLDLSIDDIARLDQRTEGWIVGLQMAAQSLKDVVMPSSFIKEFSGSHRYVLDYLVEEVLGRQPAPIQDFLLQTSILERLNGSLCEAVTGFRQWRPDNFPANTFLTSPVNTQQILEYLDRINLFLIPLDDNRQWYRYHHLFADLLLARLRQSHPEWLPLLHGRAADWYEENQFPLDAVRHALASKDEMHAARLIERFSESHILNGGFSTVLDWIRHFSTDFIQQRPWLCVWYSWALLEAGTTEGIDELVKSAENALQMLASQESDRDPHNLKAIKDQILTLQATAANYHNDHERTIELTLEALSQIQIDKDWQRNNLIYILGSKYYILGELSQAEEYYRQAKRIAERIGFFIRSILCTYRLAQIQHIRGDLSQSYDLYQAGLRMAIEQHKERTIGMGFIYTGIGEILYEWNRLEEAEQMIREGIKVDELTMIPTILANSYNIYARLLTRRGNLESARTYLMKVKDMGKKYPTSPEALEENEANWARLFLATGDWDSINAWVQERETDKAVTATFEHFQGEIAYARLLIEQKRLEQAATRLEQLAATAETGGWTDRLIEIRILQALVESACGNEGKTIHYLSKSLLLAEPNGYISVFVDEGKLVESLLKDGLEQGKWTAPRMMAHIEKVLNAF